jgi:hypothetical protein
MEQSLSTCADYLINSGNSRLPSMGSPYVGNNDMGAFTSIG